MKQCEKPHGYHVENGNATGRLTSSYAKNFIYVTVNEIEILQYMFHGESRKYKNG
jgi:hypothetical protein